MQTAIDTKMYVQSSWSPPKWTFPRALFARYQSFAYFMRHSFPHHKKKTENLLPYQHKALKQLQQSSTHIVAQCNKNLGPALIEREKYIELVLRDHLSDHHTYRRMRADEVVDFTIATIEKVHQWIRKNKKEITTTEKRFVLKSTINNDDPLPKFYATMKVHKTPLKTRPIV